MQQKISIGKQNFADMRENKYFLIDKTDFIKEWWDSGDDVTLRTDGDQEDTAMETLSKFLETNL